MKVRVLLNELYLVYLTKIFSEREFLGFPHSIVAAARIENAAWKYEQFRRIEEIFRQINYVVITLSLVNQLLHEIFAKQ